MAMTGWSSDDGFRVLHARAVPSLETCQAAFHHDRTTEVLSSLIVCGLIISYLPQHYRIIHNKSSEGFSPFFLLLGATSSACSLLNIVSLQWGQVECCHYLSAGECFESVLGIAQVFFQWFCFNLIFVLYLIFYPLTDKYVPGSFVFVYTLAVRPGVNWTGWGTYLVTGVLQGALLCLCLAWKARQRKLHIDDWGKSLDGDLLGGAEEDNERTRLVR
ncbi:hypothetical protein RQP46_010703 [Phenoliferia psychrophenolica]